MSGARVLALICLAVWLMAGSAVLMVHLHRSVMGRQGYAEWSQRAGGDTLSAPERTRALATADFELQVALKAEPWIWPSVAFGMVTPALTAGLLLMRRRQRRYPAPSRIFR